MVDHNAGPFAGAVINCIPVVGSLAGADRVAPLPERVTRHAITGEGVRLPLRFDGDLVTCGAVFFWDVRLARGDTGGGMVGDPSIAPVVGLAP